MTSLTWWSRLLESSTLSAMMSRSVPQVPLKLHGRPVVGVYTIMDWLPKVQKDLEGLFSPEFVVVEQQCQGRSSTARLLDTDLVGSLVIDHNSDVEVHVTLHRPGVRDRVKLVYRLFKDSLDTYLHGVGLECGDPGASFDQNHTFTAWPFRDLPDAPSIGDELVVAHQQAISHMQSCPLFYVAEAGPATDSSSSASSETDAGTGE